jgi:hypothetical protein
MSLFCTTKEKECLRRARLCRGWPVRDAAFRTASGASFTTLLDPGWLKSPRYICSMFAVPVESVFLLLVAVAGRPTYAQSPSQPPVESPQQNGNGQQHMSMVSILVPLICGLFTLLLLAFVCVSVYLPKKIHVADCHFFPSASSVGKRH